MLYTKYLAMVEKMGETEAKEILGDEQLVDAEGKEVKMEVVEKDNTLEVTAAVEAAVEKAMKANINNIRVTAEPPVKKASLVESMKFYVDAMVKHPGQNWSEKAATAGPTTGNAAGAAGTANSAILSPTEVYQELLGATFDSDVISMLNHIPVSFQNLNVIYRNYNAISTATISAELGVKGENALALSSRSLETKTISAIFNVSNEALSDAPQLATEVQKVLISDFQRQVENSVINGGGQFTGIVGDAATLTVQRQTAGTVSRLDFANMYSGLWHRGLNMATTRWIVNPRVWPLVDAFRDLNGVQVGERAWNSMFGIPIILSPFCPAVGSTGDVLLVDGSKYAYGVRQQPQIDFSDQLYFNYNTSSFRLDARVAGAPQQSALIPENGSNYSWFVELDVATSSGGATDFD